MRHFHSIFKKNGFIWWFFGRFFLIFHSILSHRNADFFKPLKICKNKSTVHRSRRNRLNNEVRLKFKCFNRHKSLHILTNTMSQIVDVLTKSYVIRYISFCIHRWWHIVIQMYANVVESEKGMQNKSNKSFFSLCVHIYRLQKLSKLLCGNFHIYLHTHTSNPTATISSAFGFVPIWWLY